MEQQLPKILVGFSGNPERTAMLNGRRYAEKATYTNVWNGVGGTSVNFALQAQELGLPVMAIITAGRDHDAHAMDAELQRRGLDRHMLFCREATSFATVEIDQDGGRSIRSYKPRYCDQPVEAVTDITATYQPNCVVVTGCTAEEWPLIQAMLNAPNALRVLNPRESLCTNHDVLSRLLAQTDILAINEGEYQAWVGRNTEVTKPHLQSLHELGPQIVIVTMGEKGVTISPDRHHDPLYYSAHRVGTEVDATGAGDVFLAAFLAHHLTGFDLKKAIHFATVVAGIKVTKRGGANTVTRNEILEHSPMAGFFDGNGGARPPATAIYSIGHP